MDFTYAGKEYRVVFSHPTEWVPKIREPWNETEPGRSDKRSERRIRHSIVTIYTGPRGEAEEVFAHAAVTYWNADKFSHERGRKTALRKALWRATTQWDAKESRAFRTAVWKAYHSRPGGMYEPVNPLQELTALVENVKTVLRKFDANTMSPHNLGRLTSIALMLDDIVQETTPLPIEIRLAEAAKDYGSKA